MAQRLKLGVLISGRGSNLQALIDAASAADWPAEIALVISNKAEAAGLTRAEAAGIPTCVLSHRGHADRAAFDATMTAALREAGVELVCLAGFMRLLSPQFVEAWHDRLINIHPSLLPAFRGLHVHEQAIEAGVRFTGCTVHFVRAEMDDGPIIVQAAVPVLQDDTPDSLAARVLLAEHRCYPQAVKWIAEGRVRIDGPRAIVADAPASEAFTISPG